MPKLKSVLKSDKFFLFIVLLFLLAISLLVTLINLDGNKYFIGLDPGAAFLSPNIVVKNALSAWTEFSAPGYASIMGIQSTLWNLFVLFIYWVAGFNLVWMFKILVLLYLFASGLSMFLMVLIFSRLLFNKLNKKIVYLASFFAALFYTFNHFALFLWGTPSMSFHMTYIIAPAVIAAFIFGLEFGTNFKTIFVSAILVSLLMNGNTASALVVISLLFLYFIIFMLSMTNWEEKKKSLIFVLFSVILIIFLNFYIILPLISDYENAYKTSVFPKNPTEKIIEDSYLWRSSKFNTSLTSIFSLFKLEGQNNWILYPSYLLYQKPFFNIVSSIFPILVISGLLILVKDRKKMRYIVFIFLSIIILMFFALGSNGPFPGVYYWVWETILYFKQFFKTNFQRFVPLLALFYSVILGLSLIKILTFLKKNFKRYILAYIPLFSLLIFIFLGYNWAFFSGKVIEDRYLVNPLPGDYDHLKNYFQDKDSNFKILTLPVLSSLLEWKNGSIGNKYVAGNYGPIEKYLLGAPIMSSKWFIENKIVNSDLWSDWIFEDNVDRILKHLDLFNIKYLVVHRDAINEIDFGRGGGLKRYNGRSRAENIEQTINNLPEVFQKTMETEYLSVYRVNDKYFNQHFYTPQKIIYIQGGLSSLLYLNDLYDSQLKRALYFYDEYNPQVNEFMLEKAKEIVVPFGPNMKELNRYKELTAIAQIQGERLEKIQEYQERTDLLSKAIDLGNNYRVNIPVASSYKLFLSKNSLLINQNGEIAIGNQSLSFTKNSPKKLEGDYYYIGKLNLSKGNYEIKILADDSPINMIGIWEIILKADLGEEKVMSSVDVDFIKINSTKYQIKIKNANRPFLLIFSESFHPRWKVYVSEKNKDDKIDGNTWFKKSSFDNTHFLINGYANSWWIDKTGSYNLILEFQGQKSIYIGLSVSIITLFLSIIYIIYDSRKKKKNQENKKEIIRH